MSWASCSRPVDERWPGTDARRLLGHRLGQRVELGLQTLPLRHQERITGLNRSIEKADPGIGLVEGEELLLDRRDLLADRLGEGRALLLVDQVGERGPGGSDGVGLERGGLAVQVGGLDQDRLVGRRHGVRILIAVFLLRVVLRVKARNRAGEDQG